MTTFLLPPPPETIHSITDTIQHFLPHAAHASASSTSAVATSSSSSSMTLAALESKLSLPFEDVGKSLYDSLNIGKAIGRNTGTISDSTISIVLDTLGSDVLIFLLASVVVTLVSKTIGITPILGYLLAGALLGPHGLDIFANTKADVELGDFGILFLLFSEGLEVSTGRLQQLTKYLPLGFAQISLCTGVITAALLGGFPEVLKELSIPLEATYLQEINPVEAVIVAIACTLSTSAFVFPVLKERGWEEEASGEAATSVLLLQDLMVAPLLVLLPYLVGDVTSESYAAIGFLTIKAVFGFGLTLYIGRFIIAQLFDWVSKAKSAETFVALCLLVSAGMGTIAKDLGLTDTAGAFAAGVLLSNTGYRAQIQADILPFKGILLGVFFMDAGSTFDTELALAAWPTILIGVISLIALKSVTMVLANRVPESLEPNRLSRAEGIKLALLLAGGGEFAFVVLALAERLEVVSTDLSGVLTAIILISMGLTPLLGDVAAIASEQPFAKGDEEDCDEDMEECRPWFLTREIPTNPIVVCGYGDAGHAVLHSLADAKDFLLPATTSLVDDGTARLNGDGGDTAKEEELMTCEQPYLVVFDTDPVLLEEKEMLVEDDTAVLMFGDGSNPSVIQSSGIEDPQAFFVTYEDHNDVLAATFKLRAGFPNIPIFARAQTRKEAESLKMAGASEAVVESDELARSAAGLMRTSYINRFSAATTDTVSDTEQTQSLLDVPVESNKESATVSSSSKNSLERLRQLAAIEAGITVTAVDCLLEVYDGLDQDKDGVSVDEVIAFLRRSNTGLRNDTDVQRMEQWFSASGISGKISPLEFFQLYGRAPDYIQDAFGCSDSQEQTSKQKQDEEKMSGSEELTER